MVLSFSILKDNIKLNDFDCGNTSDHKALNNFLKKRASITQKDFFGTTIVAKDNEDIVGYMTLLSDRLQVKKEKLSNFFSILNLKGNYSYESYPALKIGRLAVNKHYSYNGTRKGMKVGTNLFNLAIGIAKEANTRLGMRFIVVDAKEISKSWYIDRLNFKILSDEEPDFLYYDIKGWKKND